VKAAKARNKSYSTPASRGGWGRRDTGEVCKELMTTAPEEVAVVGLIHDQDRGCYEMLSVM
jgi:hypothetical protein